MKINSKYRKKQNEKMRISCERVHGCADCKRQSAACGLHTEKKKKKHVQEE